MNELFNQIEELEQNGFVFVIKWDGERTSGKKTVFVSKNDCDFFYRKDGDNLFELVKECIDEANKSQ